ncbi:hypothetical protein SK128_012871, partial [Halocaridina rubra]
MSRSFMIRDLLWGHDRLHEEENMGLDLSINRPSLIIQSDPGYDNKNSQQKEKRNTGSSPKLLDNDAGDDKYNPSSRFRNPLVSERNHGSKSNSHREPDAQRKDMVGENGQGNYTEQPSSASTDPCEKHLQVPLDSSSTILPLIPSTGTARPSDLLRARPPPSSPLGLGKTPFHHFLPRIASASFSGGNIRPSLRSPSDKGYSCNIALHFRGERPVYTPVPSFMSTLPRQPHPHHYLWAAQYSSLLSSLPLQ